MHKTQKLRPITHLREFYHFNAFKTAFVKVFNEFCKSLAATSVARLPFVTTLLTKEACAVLVEAIFMRKEVTPYRNVGVHVG